MRFDNDEKEPVSVVQSEVTRTIVQADVAVHIVVNKRADTRIREVLDDHSRSAAPLYLRRMEVARGDILSSQVVVTCVSLIGG
jgi:hypothetical protein